MAMPHIMVEDLVKTFRVSERKRGTWGAVAGLVQRKRRVVRALDGVGFSIEAGELVGYIGPNGAGKSTTIKILSGILVPDSGECEVFGRVPWKDRIETVRGIGVVFGQRTQLWWDLPVIESFDLLRDIYGVPKGEYGRTLDELVSLLDLESLLDVPVRQLSLGQRMKCDLAAALVHSPSLLFLDEPTIGLDAASKLDVRDFIRRRNREKGVSVILTTHDLDDIEALCTRVILIHQGRILFDGALSALRGKHSTERQLTVDLSEAGPRVDVPEAISVHQEGHRVVIRFDPRKIPAADLISRITSRYPVADLTVENPPIEEIIARLYRKIGHGTT